MKPRLKVNAEREAARHSATSARKNAEGAGAERKADAESGSFLSCLARPGLITGDESPQLT